MNGYTAELVNGNLRIKFPDVGAGWEQWFLISGDRHHDNKACLRDLELKHLKQAQERGALIVDVGDLFCAMQGKYDPRGNMDDIRPEDVGSKYFDNIVDHAADFYGPFAKNIVLLGEGNHEVSIQDHHHTNLISRLVHCLNSKHQGNVIQGGYGGWIRLQFKIRSTINHSISIKYHHGSGGGNSPVTRGTIQTNRQAVYLPDANVVINGHTHDAYHVPIARERCSQNNMRVSTDIIHFLRTPTYKDDYGDGKTGWWIVKGYPPKPRGCVWMHLVYDHDNLIDMKFMLDVM